MTRELIVREWIESERLKLLDKLEWERWHGWKTVSEPPTDVATVATVHRVEGQHWAWKARAA